jgi:transposase
VLYVGLDLSRKRLQWEAAWPDGVVAGAEVASPDADGLAHLAVRVGRIDREVVAVIESMTGARFVHDQLELAGWDVRIADAALAKGLAPLACKTDRIDAHVLCELGRRDLVPEIWLPGPDDRAERERARFRMHLAKHRTMLKNRIHQTLITHGHACPVSDLFGVRGRDLLERFAIPEPWRETIDASLRVIDHLDREISQIEADLKRLGEAHPDIPLLVTIPGVAWILGYTIAAEIGDISRFAAPAKLVAYTGLTPRVYQSGDSDHRGPLSHRGPRYLRWALIEAARHATRPSPPYHHRDTTTKQRARKKRGPKLAAIVVARKLAEATWWMLTRRRPFAPAGATMN